jgi:cytochrome c556
MSKKLVLASLTLALSASYSAVALSQAKPEVMVKQRQAAMTLQGKYFGPLGAMAQGKTPYDAKIVARNAGYLDVLDELAWDDFHPSTRDEKTRALPEIYSEQGKFKEAIERFQMEVKKLNTVARNGNGNEAEVKAQIGAVNKSCAACHDDFRRRQ